MTFRRDGRGPVPAGPFRAIAISVPQFMDENRSGSDYDEGYVVGIQTKTNSIASQVVMRLSQVRWE
ncbi:hypothetical protein L0668_11475 [Paraglaciecola aquimarina]|uniref:Uncharacterized protein n=1 Tax=Paraglaciecola algarum TaxID=3050085 RepID=A0ABS9D7G8_9ALTE|nr:hypothetical protein [Paraglaciecola sp. G1-23]MCF2948730.1 hypothetical protein [Paraglaciecola sp. G1-23]